MMVSNPGLHSVPFGSDDINFRIRRSSRKTLAITVRPSGHIFVTAPRRLKIAAIRAKVHKRRKWVRAQQHYFEQFSPRTPSRRYVTGETHLYLGRRYRLRVVSARRNDVKLVGRYIQVSLKKRSEAHVRRLLDKWIAARAQEQFMKRLEAWRPWCRQRRIQVPELRVRTMRKRWGSAHRNGRIYLNPELVRTPSVCIDYVIAHEVCHLQCPHHDKRFYRMLSAVLPNWRDLKHRLELSLA
jgi:predicted metal-dependent hydrolase